jgi:hypothetical protein
VRPRRHASRAARVYVRMRAGRHRSGRGEPRRTHFKTIGDGVLLEFPSIVAAVKCDVAIQNLMAEDEL